MEGHDKLCRVFDSFCGGASVYVCASVASVVYVGASEFSPKQILIPWSLLGTLMGYVVFH